MHVREAHVREAHVREAHVREAHVAHTLPDPFNTLILWQWNWPCGSDGVRDIINTESFTHPIVEIWQIPHLAPRFVLGFGSLNDLT